MKNELIFLKLGGSLITDKSSSNSALPEVISGIASELKKILGQFPKIKWLIGHGSGSFGHHAASKFNTQNGVSSATEWDGFHQVWQAARNLHEIVMDEFIKAELPVLSFPPSASIIAENKLIRSWQIDPLAAAVNKGFIPVIYGDVVFDTLLGGTILSTETLFSHLATRMMPDRILLAGLDQGVFADYPACKEVISNINLSNIESLEHLLTTSKQIDVTGGMKSKVQQMLELVSVIPDLQVYIFSGQNPLNLERIIMGGKIGTQISRS